MVRFRVQKGSAFAFECSSEAAQSDDLQQLFTRAEDLEALQCVLYLYVPGHRWRFFTSVVIAVADVGSKM